MIAIAAILAMAALVAYAAMLLQAFADESETNTEQKLKQKNVGSGGNPFNRSTRTRTSLGVELMPVNIDRVWTEFLMTDGRGVVQSKFNQADNFSIKIQYTVSPDLGNTNTRYQFTVDWGYPGTYWVHESAWRLRPAHLGFAMGFRGATFSGRLPHSGTAWLTTLEHRGFLTRAPNGIISYRVIIDIDGRYDLPAISELGVIAIGDVSNWPVF